MQFLRIWAVWDVKCSDNRCFKFPWAAVAFILEGLGCKIECKIANSERLAEDETLSWNVIFSPVGHFLPGILPSK